MEYYLIINRDIFKTFVGKCIHLENIILSEINQIENLECCVVFLILVIQIQVKSNIKVSYNKSGKRSFPNGKGSPRLRMRERGEGKGKKKKKIHHLHIP